MRYHRVNSSFISYIGYDAKARVLRVVIGGRTYDYTDVSRHTVRRLINGGRTKSTGRFYAKAIRGHYARAIGYVPTPVVRKTAAAAA